MLRFIEENSVAIIGTLVFHIVLMGLFNVWYLIPAVETQRQELVDIVLEPEELEQLLRTQEARYEKITADEVTTGFKNMNMKERLEQGKKVKLDKATEKWTEERIKNELKELEQSEFERLAEERGPTPEFTPKTEQKEDPDNNPIPVDQEEGTIAGAATVTCDLKGRTEVGRVYIPAYLCKGQGKVVINIAVNRLGIVEQAKIDQTATTSSMPCHLNFAKEAAESTKFDRDNGAPNLQHGTITYLFLAQ